MLRRLLSRLLAPALRLALRWASVDDPWRPVGTYVRVDSFGRGSRKPFDWYLEGESSVPVSSLSEITLWLSGCDYVTDPELFHEADFWQHPKTFEALRKGDCEDFALWAWRKLLELGLDAHFFVGHRHASGPDSWHAWVVFGSVEGEFLMEPAARTLDSMIRPLAKAKPEYAPHFSVDRAGKKCSYEGYLLFLNVPRHNIKSDSGLTSA